jgi:dTDP-4-amino-4,6-dideoxygalactose transaminase
MARRSDARVAVDRVPFADLRRQHDPIDAKLRAAFERVVARADFVLGEELDAFESEFAEYVGVCDAVGVGSGTAALTIATRAAGISVGHEVIVPALTYIASALGVLHSGATPVFCDVEEATGLLDLESAAFALSERTAAIVAVHLYGQACDMDALLEFAGRHGIAVVEDAAQAHGASWRGRKTGSLGLVSAFSFYPSKNLGALGDGGAVCTDDPEIATQVRRLRNLGQQDKGEHLVAGYNERLDTLQAALLRVKLGHLDRWNSLRRASAGRYLECLPDGVQTLPDRSGANDVYHLFPIRVKERDHVRRALADAGVETGLHYAPPVHLQPPFKREAASAPLPVAERWAREELSLPMFPGLTEAEVMRVCDAFDDAVEGGAAASGSIRGGPV